MLRAIGADMIEACKEHGPGSVIILWRSACIARARGVACFADAVFATYPRADPKRVPVRMAEMKHVDASGLVGWRLRTIIPCESEKFVRRISFARIAAGRRKRSPVRARRKPATMDALGQGTA